MIVPVLIRNQLQPGKAATLNGFVTKRVVNNASRIDIQFAVTDLVEQTQSRCSEEEFKRLDISGRK